MKGKVSISEEARCHLCGMAGAHGHAPLQVVTARPQRENDFGISPGDYKRQVYQCGHCGVYFNRHGHIGADFYKGVYNQAVYNHKLLEKYSRIMALPEEKSDNRRRVKRIKTFCDRLGWKPDGVRVLDVGSGLCVFLGALKESGFRCYCVDPDPEAVRHAVENIKVEGGFAGTLEEWKTQEKFDLITFNKVLEHVEKPAAALAAARRFLTARGIVYVELPDGESALKNGNAVDREEFYIEHFTVFNEKSLRYLAEAAGFEVLEMVSIHEPSDKYTIYGFLKPHRG